jgi:hypothetical protein
VSIALWNADLEEQLIDLYAGNPCLWDIHQQEYMIATKSEEKLRHIATALENKFTGKLNYNNSYHSKFIDLWS